MVNSNRESGHLLEDENIIPEEGEDREGKNKRDVQRSTERRRVRATSILSSCIIQKHRKNPDPAGLLSADIRVIIVRVSTILQ